MRPVSSNVHILLRDQEGRVVPGSERSGHNVMTNVGRDSLAQLIAWGTIGTPDVELSPKRARYIGVGGGTQPEDPGVTRLVSPLDINGSSVYLKELDPSLTIFSTFTSVTVKAVFSQFELNDSFNAVIVSEAGLFFDGRTFGLLALDVESPENPPSFYKSFEPLVKMVSFSMEIAWELQF